MKAYAARNIPVESVLFLPRLSRDVPFSFLLMITPQRSLPHRLVSLPMPAIAMEATFPYPHFLHY